MSRTLLFVNWKC